MISNEIALNKIEHNWEKFYTLKKGDIFVEVGAFTGGYAILLKERECNIILIEPSPLSADTIYHNIKKYDLKNTILIRKAISNKKGITSFNDNGNTVFNGNRMTDTRDPCQACWSLNWILIGNNKKRCINCGSEMEITNHNTIQVETDTLDNILTEIGIDHVDLLACDCEGCEYCLMKGIKKYLSNKKIKNIALATYHINNELNIKIRNILKNNGFKDIIFDKEVTYCHL